jgi:hypothetical protein
VSLTEISMCELMRSSLTCTRPPRGVNLMAFDSRFHTTCWSLTGSPATVTTPVSITLRSVTPFASAAGRTASTAASMKEFGSTGRTSMRSLPVMARDTSRRSSMSCACARALRSMVSKARPALPPSSCPMRSMCAQPRIAVSGVRSSCETVARNSSFRRFASCASR